MIDSFDLGNIEALAPPLRISQLDEFFSQLTRLPDKDRLSTFEVAFALPLINCGALRETILQTRAVSASFWTRWLLPLFLDGYPDSAFGCPYCVCREPVLKRRVGSHEASESHERKSSDPSPETSKERREFLTLVIAAIVNLLHHQFRDHADPDGMYSLLSETMQGLEEQLGWSEHGVAIARLILFSLTTKIGSSADGFRGDLLHHSWHNLFGVLQFVEEFVLYRPCRAPDVIRPKEPSKTPVAGLHVDWKGAIDVSLVENVVKLLSTKLKVDRLQIVQDPDKKLVDGQRKVKDISLEHLDYFSNLLVFLRQLGKPFNRSERQMAIQSVDRVLTKRVSGSNGVHGRYSVDKKKLIRALKYAFEHKQMYATQLRLERAAELATALYRSSERRPSITHIATLKPSHSAGDLARPEQKVSQAGHCDAPAVPPLRREIMSEQNLNSKAHSATALRKRERSTDNLQKQKGALKRPEGLAVQTQTQGTPKQSTPVQFHPPTTRLSPNLCPLLQSSARTPNRDIVAAQAQLQAQSQGQALPHHHAGSRSTDLRMPSPEIAAAAGACHRRSVSLNAGLPFAVVVESPTSPTAQLHTSARVLVSPRHGAWLKAQTLSSCASAELTKMNINSTPPRHPPIPHPVASTNTGSPPMPIKLRPPLPLAPPPFNAAAVAVGMGSSEKDDDTRSQTSVDSIGSSLEESEGADSLLKSDGTSPLRSGTNTGASSVTSTPGSAKSRASMIAPIEPVDKLVLPPRADLTKRSSRKTPPPLPPSGSARSSTSAPTSGYSTSAETQSTPLQGQRGSVNSSTSRNSDGSGHSKHKRGSALWLSPVDGEPGSAVFMDEGSSARSVVTSPESATDAGAEKGDTLRQEQSPLLLQMQHLPPTQSASMPNPHTQHTDSHPKPAEHVVAAEGQPVVPHPPLLRKPSSALMIHVPGTPNSSDQPKLGDPSPKHAAPSTVVGHHNKNSGSWSQMVGIRSPANANNIEPNNAKPARLSASHSQQPIAPPPMLAPGAHPASKDTLAKTPVATPRPSTAGPAPAKNTGSAHAKTAMPQAPPLPPTPSSAAIKSALASQAGHATAAAGKPAVPVPPSAKQIPRAPSTGPPQHNTNHPHPPLSRPSSAVAVIPTAPSNATAPPVPACPAPKFQLPPPPIRRVVPPPPARK